MYAVFYNSVRVKIAIEHHAGTSLCTLTTNCLTERGCFTFQIYLKVDKHEIFRLFVSTIQPYQAHALQRQNTEISKQIFQEKEYRGLIPNFHIHATSKYWAASYKNAFNPPTCWDHGLYSHKPQSFPPNQSPKMRESQQLVFGLRLVRRIFEENLTSCNPYQNSATPLSNKHEPANRETGFYTNRNPNKQEVGFNFVWSGSELWSLFKYSEVKLKNQEHIAVDVLFKAYPMVPLSRRSNLARRYL